MDPYRYELYRSNVPGKLRVETTVWTVVTKDTMSLMVMLAGEIEQETSDVIDYGMVSFRNK